MKKILIQRGKSDKPITLENGDKYDSKMVVAEENNVLFISNRVNTDPTAAHRDTNGLLAPGDYYGIVGAKQYGDKAIWIFNRNVDISKIKSRSDLLDSMVTLPSLKPNNNAGGAKTMSYILIHMGGYRQDYSEGCVTVHPIDWANLLPILAINEILQVTLA
jgi:hypothetical protein